ncbi:SDR family NAD(P)-dependent oxidoreductase [Thermodesulfobacteriota bacterium]
MILEGKVALVLGSIKGIGKEICLALAREGAMVAVNYFDWQSSLAELEDDLARTGERHLILRTNLLETDCIGPMVDSVAQHFGRLDILINNIERGGWPLVHGPYTEHQWDLELHTTLRAKSWAFSAALPHLKASEEAVVINISSIAGIVGRAGPASPVFNDGYAAANRGISLLTETWARLGAPSVRVNEIMLGFFETRHGSGTRGWGLMSTGEKKAILRHTLLGRTGTVSDAVKAVLFMIRDAPFMTGSVLRLDGGYVLGADRTGPMPTGAADPSESHFGA